MTGSDSTPIMMPDATLDAAYARARVAEKTYKAKLVELAYKSKAGKLVDEEEVKRESFQKGRKLRDILLTSARRIAPFVAAESSAEKCEKILDDAFKDIIIKYIEGDNK